MLFCVITQLNSEMNYIKCADTPVVFHSLNDDHELIWGGSIVEPFDPSTLAISLVTNRLYHPVTSKKKGKGVSPGLNICYE